MSFFSPPAVGGATPTPQKALSERCTMPYRRRDQDKHIDRLAPESRMTPGFFFWEQVIRAGVGLFGVDASDLTEVTWKDMQFQAVDNDGFVAHVWVTAKLRLLSVGMEVPCTIVVRKRL